MSRCSRLYKLIAIPMALFLFCNPAFASHAQAYREHENLRLALTAKAERMELNPLLFTDADAYLRVKERRNLERHAVAMEQLEENFRADPEAQKQQKLIAQTVKDMHAASRYGGLAEDVDELGTLLSDLDRALSHGQDISAHWQQFDAYRHALSQGKTTLSEYFKLEHARLASNGDRQAIARLNVRKRYAERVLEGLNTLLDDMPTADANPASQADFLQRVQTFYDRYLPVPSDNSPRDSAGLATHYRRSQIWPLRHSWPTSLLDEGMLKIGNWLQTSHRWIAGTLGSTDSAVKPSGWHEPLIPPSERMFNFSAPQYLEETPEVQFTPELINLIDNLEREPVRMYHFVRNEVNTELYFGSKKGSIGTLAELAGNDIDQASLLIAMFRAAGIPSHYVYGLVRLTEQQAHDFTGVLPTTSNADMVSALGSAGYPVLGTSEYIEIELTWVRAYVPYTNYRGIDAGESHPIWIDLIPAIKQYTFLDGVDVRPTAEFDRSAYLREVTQTLPIEIFEQSLRIQLLESGRACTPICNTTPRRLPIRETLGVLPPQLPVLVRSELDTFSRVPDDFRYSVTLALDVCASPLVDPTCQYPDTALSYTTSLPELYGRRVAIEYPDFTIPGSCSDTITPKLTVDGQEIISGPPLPACVDARLHSSFDLIGLQPADIADSVRIVPVGALAVFAMSYHTVPQTQVDARLQTVRDLQKADASEAAWRPEWMYMAGLSYLRQWDDGRSACGRAALAAHHCGRQPGDGCTEHNRPLGLFGSAGLDLAGRVDHRCAHVQRLLFSRWGRLNVAPRQRCCRLQRFGVGAPDLGTATG